MRSWSVSYGGLENGIVVCHHPPLFAPDSDCGFGDLQSGYDGGETQSDGLLHLLHRLLHHAQGNVFWVKVIFSCLRQILSWAETFLCMETSSWPDSCFFLPSLVETVVL